MPRICAVVALGRIAHESFVSACGKRRAEFPFGHGRAHPMDTFTLFDSYHCSRYNTNTRVLTPEMFRTVFRAVRSYLDARSHATTVPALSSGGNTG
jgi:uracil-DNA glycosylase